MTITQLTEIVSTGDRNHIQEQLKQQGYISCFKRKYNQPVDKAALFLGDLYETELFADEPNNLTYQGGIYMNVQNHENFEFINICVGNLSDGVPVEITTWAKQIANRPEKVK